MPGAIPSMYSGVSLRENSPFPATKSESAAMTSDCSELAREEGRGGGGLSTRSRPPAANGGTSDMALLKRRESSSSVSGDFLRGGGGGEFCRRAWLFRGSSFLSFPRASKRGQKGPGRAPS